MKLPARHRSQDADEIIHDTFSPFITNSYTIGIKKKKKFRCSVAILNTQGEVAMETELHWPEMNASEDLDFHCT